MNTNTQVVTLRKAASEMREYAARGIAWGPEWDGDYAADGGWLAPPVALAVAAWLDTVADRDRFGQSVEAEPALKVARAYLGEAAPD